MEENNDNSSVGDDIDDPKQINWFVLIFTLVAVIVFSSVVTSLVENNMKKNRNFNVSNNTTIAE